jgi:hypothetical protein
MSSEKSEVFAMRRTLPRIDIEMPRAFNEGTIKPMRPSQNRTLTRFEDFAG